MELTAIRTWKWPHSTCFVQLTFAPWQQKSIIRVNLNAASYYASTNGTPDVQRSFDVIVVSLPSVTFLLSIGFNHSPVSRDLRAWAACHLWRYRPAYICVWVFQWQKRGSGAAAQCKHTLCTHTDRGEEDYGYQRRTLNIQETCLPASVAKGNFPLSAFCSDAHILRWEAAWCVDFSSINKKKGVEIYFFHSFNLYIFM